MESTSHGLLVSNAARAARRTGRRKSPERLKRQSGFHGPLSQQLLQEFFDERPQHCAPVRAEHADLILEDHQVTLVRDDRRYRVRGLEQNHSSLQLRVNILASREELVYLDTLDLLKARARNSFIKAAAAELYVDQALIKQDVGGLLLALEQQQQAQIEAATKAQNPKCELTTARRQAALELLRDPKLVNLPINLAA